MSIKRFIVVSVILFFLPLSCDELDVLFVNCSKCYNENPENADVTILFTLNSENKSVPYTVYQGNVEDGEIIIIDTAYQKSMTWNLPVGYKYSVIAEYASKGRSICVIDGDKLRTSLDQSSCSQDCYIILGDRLDARLKY